MTPAAFEADRLVKRYRHVPVLSGIGFRVKTGEAVCLLGPNGAGKTTLLRIAATLVRPSAGEVRFGGISASEAVPAVRGRIGFASHQSLLYPELTVVENLRFHARLQGVPVDIGELLETHGLAHASHTPARLLSRGTAQRASLARALLHRPDLLLLDEPFAGLDGASRERLARMIHEARERGVALILATHDVPRGLELANRATVLHEGRVVLERPVSERSAIRRAYDVATGGA